MTDKIGLLKKMELKFHQFLEQRTVFQFFDEKTLMKQEKEIKDRVS